MKVQSTVKVSKIKAPISNSLQGLVIEETHDVAWTSDSNDLMPDIGASSSFTSTDGSKFYTASLDDLGHTTSTKEQKKRKEAFATLVTTGTTLVKEYFPEAEGAVDGMELMVASLQAYESWTDTERVGVVKPTMKTAKAVVEALDILAPIVPPLQVLEPHLKTVGLVVKMGDLAYQVFLEPTPPASAV